MHSFIAPAVALLHNYIFLTLALMHNYKYNYMTAAVALMPNSYYIGPAVAILHVHNSTTLL